MISITITGELTGGKALLYELPKRQGRRAFVPTYHAVMECSPTHKRFEFAVVRNSSPQVFGKELAGPYAEGGECPPSADTPYMGRVREDGAVGFRVQLFELGCEQAETLVGQGTTLRKHIQIHFGAAASNGCIMVAGRRREYHSGFAKQLRGMLAFPHIIQVTVLPRYQ